MGLPTAEQRATDAHRIKSYRRAHRRELASAEEFEREVADLSTCEELRVHLLAVAAELKVKAEALRSPVTRWRSVLEPLPTIDEKYPGEGVEDLLAEVEEVGKLCRRLARRKVAAYGGNAKQEG